MQRTLTLLASAALGSMLLCAQPGTLDATFNPGTGANGSVEDLVLQPDGKVIIVGSFTAVGGTTRNRIARLNADGSLDTGFNPGAGADDFVTAVAVQNDGKVVIGGFFTTVGGTSRNFLARLNSDGTLDASFNTGSGPNGAVLDIAVQPDGKVLIGGFFSAVNGAARIRVARLNTDGSVDTGFTTGAGASGSVLAMALQADGKVLIGGEFLNYNNTARSRIARLNADGTLDTGFNPGTGLAGSAFGFVDVLAIAVQPDGKVIIGGRFESFNGTPRSNLVRLNSNGSLDTGGFPTGAGQTFSMALQTNGKLLTGAFMFLGRLTANGANDTDFITGTSVDSWVYAIAVQPDGKILVGGTFTNYNGTTRNGIMRVNGDAINVGMDETMTTSNALRIYPNPSNGGIVWMDVPQGMNGNMQLEVIGADGRIVQHSAIDPTVVGTEAQQIALDVDPLVPAGSYVVRIISASSIHTGRLSISR
ncbi:MAG: T9SS type A sorting domain-containing protein [Flavobacteriales bacterium]